ncbi:hypothetical protein ACFXTO_041259 [Malus domestica]
MPEVGLIFISSASLDTYYSNMGYANKKLYASFLRVENSCFSSLHSSFAFCVSTDEHFFFLVSVVLRPFCRITRRVDELSPAFSPFFTKYCEPITDLNFVPNKETNQRQKSPEVEVEVKERKGKGDTRKFGDCEVEQLDFHMLTSAKHLLISAFLASRNPATLDSSMFNSTGGSSSQKRKRMLLEKSMEQKETAEHELLLNPGSFPMERLLAIFQCITSVGEGPLDEEEQEYGRLGIQDRNDVLMSDVLLLLSSLCSVNFIVTGGSCPLEGSTRYRSTVSEDMALKVARSIKFPLSKYMYR